MEIVQNGQNIRKSAKIPEKRSSHRGKRRNVRGQNKKYFIQPPLAMRSIEETRDKNGLAVTSAGSSSSSGWTFTIDAQPQMATRVPLTDS